MSGSSNATSEFPKICENEKPKSQNSEIQINLDDLHDELMSNYKKCELIKDSMKGSFGPIILNK